MKLTCPNCGRVHPLGEPYPQPGGRILCGCGRKLAVRYPAGALERLRNQGAKFLDESPPVRPTAPGKTLLPVESQEFGKKGWNLSEDEEATTLFRADDIEEGLPPARPPVRHEEPPARRPTTITPSGVQMRQRLPQRAGPRSGYVDDSSPLSSSGPDVRAISLSDIRDDAPTALLPNRDATSETEEAPPVRALRAGDNGADGGEIIDMASASMESMPRLAIAASPKPAPSASSMEPVASPSGPVPMPTLVPETSISVPLKPKLNRATVDGPRAPRGDEPILVERAGSSHTPDAAARDVHVFLPDGVTTPAPPPPVVPPPSAPGLEPMAAADPSVAARALPTGDTTNTAARRGATLDEIQRLRVPVEAPKPPAPKATGDGKLLLAGAMVLLLLVLAALAFGAWALFGS